MPLAQGRSFAANLRGETPADWRREIYYRYWTNHDIRPAHMAIRTDRYKLIFYYGHPLDMTDSYPIDYTPSWDLYDLKEDPGENCNVYGQERYAPVVKRLKADLMRLRREAGDTDERYPEMQRILSEYYW